LENLARNRRPPTEIFCSGFWIAGCATLAGMESDFFVDNVILKPLAQKKETESVFPTRSLLNQMVLKALRIVAIGRKSSRALSGKGMKPN
jgi:hypothetical protein